MNAREVFAASLRSYAGLNAFRSAEGFELLFEGNPFHRPVRPNDLSFVDFSRPIDATRLSELSALMGQRVLLNSFECETAFLSHLALNLQASADRAEFYSANSTASAATLRPFLLAYLQTWLTSAAPAEDLPLCAMIDSGLARCVKASNAALMQLHGGTNAARMARMAVVQLAGPALSRELAIARWMCVDWSGQLAEHVNTFAISARRAPSRLMALAKAGGVLATPHSNWQFYLPTWLGVANYLHACTRSPERFDEALGAVMLDRLCWTALGEQWDQALGHSLDIGRGTDQFACTLLPMGAAQTVAWREPLIAAIDARAAVHGTAVLRSVARGVHAMQQLWTAAFDELSAQAAWAGQMERSHLIARRFMELIAGSASPPDMESYDEPSSERSTTHVHDTHRLLVIDSGEMDFWHSLGAPEHFVPGDMLFVPRHRLHGSVVTTARCRYHQPIIGEALMLAYEQKWGAVGAAGG